MTGRRATGIAIVLVSIDLLLISADLLRHNGLLHDIRFAVTTERGYGEWFQYVKTALVVLLLLAAHRRSPARRVWASLFVYLLLDDAFALHEAFGRFAASILFLPAIRSIHPAQMGELLLFAAVGVVFVGAVAVLQRADAESRSLTISLGPPVAVLVFFGAGVDMLHSFLTDQSHRYAAGLIEDGGEMLAMSVLVATAYWVAMRKDQGAIAGERNEKGGGTTTA